MYCEGKAAAKLIAHLFAFLVIHVFLFYFFDEQILCIALTLYVTNVNAAEASCPLAVLWKQPYRQQLCKVYT